MHDDGPKILVVDDDPATRMILQGVLEDEGCCVTAAGSGHEAVSLASEAFFALIFMDMMMPGINGLQAYLAIREISPKSVVVMMTGHGPRSSLPRPSRRARARS